MYQQLLGDEKENALEELLYVRQCVSGEFESHTKWEGYINDQNMWEKIETNKLLIEL